MTSHKPLADQQPVRIYGHVWAPLPWPAAGSTGHLAEEEVKDILKDTASWWHSEGDSLFCQLCGLSARLGFATLEKHLEKASPGLMVDVWGTSVPLFVWTPALSTQSNSKNESQT